MEPSDEQAAALALAAAGACLQISAVPGAGKSSFAMMLIERCRAQRALILTYNRALAEEVSAKLEARGLRNARASTIHSLIGRVSGRVVTSDSALLEVLEAWESMPERVDLLVLDEVQDYTPLLVRAVVCAIAPGCQVVVLGDPCQLLYDFPSLEENRASAEYLVDAPRHFAPLAAPGCAWHAIEFTRSFRLTPNVAALCSAYWGGGRRIVGANTTSGNRPVEMLAVGSFDDLVRERLVEMVDEFGPDEVLVLCQTTQSRRTPVRKHINVLLTAFPRYAFHISSSPGDGASATGKIRVNTFCGAKGLEARAVMVIGFHVYDRAKMSSLNQICVACSRARELLVVVSDPKYEVYPAEGDLAVETAARLQRLRELGVVGVPESCGDATAELTPHPISIKNAMRVSPLAYRELMATGQLVSRVRREAEIELETRVQLGRFVEDVSSVYGEAIPLALARERAVVSAPRVDMEVALGRAGSQCTRSQFVQKLRAFKIALSEHAEAALYAEDFASEAGVEPFCAAVNDVARFGEWRNAQDQRVSFVVEPSFDSIFEKHYSHALKAVENEPVKRARHYCFLANAYAARNATHARFVQCGRFKDYAAWVDDKAFQRAVGRLRAEVPDEPDAEWEVPLHGAHFAGVADWVWRAGRVIYEFKFKRDLGDDDRLQLLAYCALFLHEDPSSDVVGILFNAKTCEREKYVMTPEGARALLARLARANGVA